MSDKCYACRQPKREKPMTLREQWLWADLDEKLIAVFFVFLGLSMLALMLVGISALIIEAVNTI